MPPSGTRSSSKSSGAGRDSSRGLGKGAGGSAIGKSSSAPKGGVRGPTGPQGQARTSPAGSGGGKAGSISRSGARGPTGPKGQARTSPAGGKSGAVTPKSEFQRFQERYPGGTRSMNVKDIPSPMPGGFGPAGNAVRGVLTGARGLVGRLTGQSAAATKKAKQIAEIEKKIPRLERMKQSEAVRLGKPSKPGKLPDKLPPMTLKQIREANKPLPGYQKLSDKYESAIDRVTDALGFGTGAVARTKAAAVAGAPVNAAYEGANWVSGGGLDRAKEAYSSAREKFGNALYGSPAKSGTGFKRGGLVKKPGNFKRKKK